MKKNTKMIVASWFGVFIVAITFYVINNSSNFSRKDVLNSESETQAKCRITSEQAFNNYSVKLSKQFYDTIVAGSENNINLVDSKLSYKYNYNSSINLCLIEYVFSWKIKDISTGNIGEILVKIGDNLISGTHDPTTQKESTIASLVIATSPSGSQLVKVCSVQTPGHYDDISKKSINELLTPTQCTSELGFDSIVYERLGIK